MSTSEQGNVHFHHELPKKTTLIKEKLFTVKNENPIPVAGMSLEIQEMPCNAWRKYRQ